MSKLSLAVFNTQPPHLYFGGVERRILETAKRLSKQLDITVYSGTKAGFKKPTKVNGLSVVPCFSTDLLFPLDNWFYSHSLAKHRDSIKATVFEAHNASGYAFIKSLKKKGPKTPFIQTVHGLLADEYFKTLESGALSPRDKLANLMTWHLSKLEAESARAADFVVTVSKYSAKRAAQLYYVDEKKTWVTPNGVDPDRFKPAQNEEALRKRFGLEQNKVVLFVGRLIPRKGLHFLVNTASQIVKELENVKFVLVGDGPLRADLESSLATLGLSKHFLFLGDVEEGILPSLYNCADVFALPSLQEGQGIALLEAQASSKPVVAFNIGGVNEAVVNGQTGLLVDKGSGEQLCQAIMRLLADESLRSKLGDAGRKFVLTNYTWDICARKMLDIYEKAAK